MHLHRFIIPLANNEGTPYSFAHFEDQLLRYYGGFTHTFGQGQWRDETGRTYADMNAIYDLALPNTNAINAILVEIARCFPGQKALAHAHIGEMDIATVYIDGSVDDDWSGQS